MSLILGQPITDFEVASTGNKIIRSADFRGKKLLLYFYPKDNTPGCTQEGLDFKAHFEQFQQLNVIVFGVSRDSVKVHEGFKCKQEFPFDLLSDQDETLCRLFDVIKNKMMYGKPVVGIERSTFLIDEQGVLRQEWRKVQVKTHVQEVLNYLNAGVS